MAKKTKANSWDSKLTGYETRFLLKQGIRIYPVYDMSWFIEVDNNGNLKRFDKRVATADINESIEKTVIYYYNLLNQKK